ncbi:MAG: hypothetical protein M1820_009653 [Bogoriella megaspora]|nr:MAG: hypothetical protein M1820_009653 [Bogoriella megaspora]
MCNVGLNTVNLGMISGYQQSILFVLMLMGDLSLVSISVVLVRRYYFGKYIEEFLQRSKAGQRVAGDIERNDASLANRANRREQFSSQAEQNNRGMRTRSQEHKDPAHVSSFGGFIAPWNRRFYRRIFKSILPSSSKRSTLEHPYLSSEPQLDHKGRFQSLTVRQEQELGGVEYRALCILTWLLPAYTLFWLFLIMVVMTPYVSETSTSNIIRTSQPGSLNPAWWSVFATVSGYTNCGLNLLDQNMIPLSSNYLVLIFTGMAVLTGNVLYPVFLRGAVWSLSRLVPTHSPTHHALMFLLHHPRRCYLFLFPAKNTWILFGVQVGINLTAWVLFIILNINYTPIDPLIPGGLRAFDGLYQSLGVRSSGFYITLISDVAPALQFFYMVTMYISAFPIIMSIRQTNIYEERSLGQADESKSQAALNDAQNKQDQPKSQLGQHVRRQLAYDIWWILIAIWLISIIEREKLVPSPPAATTPPQTTSLPSAAPGYGPGLFAIMFETISAYGTVGLSLGVPYDNYSFSGSWRTLSKLILLTVMLRGRHRILPMAIDRAILLPGQGLMEELDKSRRADEADEQWERIEGEIRREEEGEDEESEDAADGDSENRRGGEDRTSNNR